MQLVEKHLEEMMSTGKIPKEIQDAFGEQSDELDFDDLFSSMGISHGIWKKGIFILI